jgi:hypothetical protein
VLGLCAGCALGFVAERGEKVFRPSYRHYAAAAMHTQAGGSLVSNPFSKLWDLAWMLTWMSRKRVSTGKHKGCVVCTCVLVVHGRGCAWQH